MGPCFRRDDERYAVIACASEAIQKLHRSWIASSRSLSSGAHCATRWLVIANPNTRPHSRGTMCPSFATNLPPKNRGRGERRVPAAPTASRAKVESTRVWTADTPVHPAFPHAMVLTVSFVISPVTGLDCHRRRRNECGCARSGPRRFRRLDASVGASGPHDFAVRRCIIRPRAVRSLTGPKDPPCHPVQR
jgi:hypothetical protein